MAVPSEITYPPTMPLYADRIRHSRVHESLWASPLPFTPFLITTTIVFLAGLGALYASTHKMLTIGTLSPHMTLIIISIIPAVLLVLFILGVSKSSSPAYAYQVDLFRNPDDTRTRWNLAVVSTAHIYLGQIAQTEWMSLLPELTEKERFRALDYIRLVIRRLQRFPLILRHEIGAMVVASIVVAVTSYFALDYTDPILATLNGIALLVVLQLFLLYTFLQRWQHTRRLYEVEEIYEELLPSQRPAEDLPAPSDEVGEWYRAQAELKSAPSTKPEAPQPLPRAPWE